MKVQRTVTLDDDLIEFIERLAKQNRSTFAQTLNCIVDDRMKYDEQRYADHS